MTEAEKAALRTFGGIHEVYEVRTYEGYRETADDGTEKVTIRVIDYGPNFGPAGRYTVQVESASGKTARGNNADSIEEAIGIVHWGDLK